MNRRNLFVLIGLAAAFLAGRALAPSGESLLGTSPAFAGDGTLHVREGDTFVSADGGTAYLWRYDGRRVELLGATKSVEGSEEQATFIWMPGVERRK
jgi:hypothetical protein